MRPVLAGQSGPLFEPTKLLITTPTQEKLLQKYKERVERLSQQDQVIKICTDAGFLKTVEVGQYFMTKDTDEFSQFTEPVTCREYTLPRDEKSTDPKGWIRGNTKIGPVMEVTTSYQGKYGVESRIKFVNKDNSHSWVRISHGLNKLVTDLIDKDYDDNEQGTSETKTEAFALKTDVFVFASRSKAEAKPRRPTSACSSARTIPVRESIWTDIEPGAQSNQAYPVAKRLNTLLRHGQLPREEDGAIEFWEIEKIIFGTILGTPQFGSDETWKSKMAGGGGNKKRFQYCTDLSGQEIHHLRALQGHSGRNPIDPSLQDNVLIPDNFFEYFCHIGCTISLHSITNSGFIAGGQNSSRERQTVFFTAVNSMDKDHKDPYELDLTKPRLASYKQKKWKRHQDTVYWVDIQLAQRRGLKFYQTRCNAIILYDTLPAYCISKVVVMASGKIKNEKAYVSPQPPPTISFKVIG